MFSISSSRAAAEGGLWASLLGDLIQEARQRREFSIQQAVGRQGQSLAATLPDSPHDQAHAKIGEDRRLPQRPHRIPRL